MFHIDFTILTTLKNIENYRKKIVILHFVDLHWHKMYIGNTSNSTKLLLVNVKETIKIYHRKVQAVSEKEKPAHSQ